ncbi:hypothetical protein ATL41_0981 [Flavimobilis soli]|uniref:Integral membrane protein n=1 Tax=Flavimobilis soli TaxID=442709 RepID=A0A2A9EDB7_9MICO|nr:hypothetical protein [Flavimobilis soli]PFG36265.1 hypothetical protein ATL41_0981 [Flavimobilis soli]
MDIVYKVMLVLHLLSWAFILGSLVANLKDAKIAKGAFHAALTALVTGVVMVGLKEMGDGSVNHMKIGIKLLVTIVITVLTVLGEKKPERVTKGYIGGILALVVLNVSLAIGWGDTHTA